MSLLIECLCKPLWKVFQYFVLAVCNSLSQERSWCHTRCAKFQIFSIFCLSLLCPNDKLKLACLLIINGSFQIPCHLSGWIFWWSFWISWCDLDDLICQKLHTIHQSHLHCSVNLCLIKFHCTHFFIWLYHIKPANDHHFNQILVLVSQILHHTKHPHCPGSCLTLWSLVQNPIWSCGLFWCTQLAHWSIYCIALISKAKGIWSLFRLLLAMSCHFLKFHFWSQLLDKWKLSCWNRLQNYSINSLP